MLTYYTIILMTTDADGDPLEESHFAPFMEDVEVVLARQMNEGDTALVYQVDALSPRTAEEAVAWLQGEPKIYLRVLVAEVTRDSEYEAPNLTPTTMGSLSGFMYSPKPEAQA